MHALVHLCINQHTTFEVSSVTNSNDMIESKILKKKSRDLDHAHLATLASAVSEDTIAGIEMENRSCDADHAPLKGGLSSVR